MTEAMRIACEHVARYTGSCPYDIHNDECADWENDCVDKCCQTIDMAACWQRYFEQSVRNGATPTSATLDDVNKAKEICYEPVE